MKPPANILRVDSIALILALNASLALAQAPFTEVLDSGDLGQAISQSQGASWGDYDGDGDIDLFICTILQSANLVFRNDGDGRFSRMTSNEIGDLGSEVSDAVMALWADMDNDGDLDVYVANYSEAEVVDDWWDLDNPPLAQEDRLYLNDGTGRFVRTQMPGLSDIPLYSFGANLVDYDVDGLLDVFVTTSPIVEGWSGPDHLFHNEGALTFSTGPFSGLATVGWSSSWADYDQDGDLDMLINDSERTPVLYHHHGAEGGGAVFSETFEWSNGEPFGEKPSSSAWGDYDNDGDLDILMKRGSEGDLWTNLGGGAYERSDSYWSSATVWLDYDNDGYLDLLIHGWQKVGTDNVDDGFFLYKGDGQGGFEERRLLEAGPDGQLNWGGVVGDFDNDGCMDILIPNFTYAPSPALSPDRLFRNNGNSNHWLKLVLSGTDSNRSAIGAVVRVKATIRGEEVWQMRQIMAGDGLPYAQRDMRPNFGLGGATVAELVRIEWPSGTVQELSNVAADQILTVVEPPRLRIDTPDRLSWPAAAGGFQLESATSVDGEWSEASETVETNGSRKSVTVQTDGSDRFYRLRKQ